MVDMQYLFETGPGVTRQGHMSKNGPGSSTADPRTGLDTKGCWDPRPRLASLGIQ